MVAAGNIVRCRSLRRRIRTYNTRYGQWDRKKGELLRPDADDIEDIERMRRKLEFAIPSFDLLYQQDAEAQSLPPLTAEHFLSFDEDAVRNLPHFISIDPGTDKGDGRSYSVVQLWATNGDNYYLIDLVRERCDFSELVRITKRMASRNDGVPILIENTANGPALISALSKKQRGRTHAITPRGSKTTRFRKHDQKFVTGRIRIRNDAPFREKFIEEMIQFPHGRHDDQVDAMTQLLDHVEENRDEIDFSRTNIKRSGLIAGAGNSQYQPMGSSGQQDQKAPGLGAVALNSSCRAATGSGQPAFDASRLNSPFRPQMSNLNLGVPWWHRYGK